MIFKVDFVEVSSIAAQRGNPSAFQIRKKIMGMKLLNWITVRQGVTFRRQPYKFESVGTDGTRTPVNLTGKIIVFRLKNVLSGGETDYVLRSDAEPTGTGSFIALTNAAAGEFNLVISDEDTATFSKKQTNFSIIAENTDGTKDLIGAKEARIIAIYE